MNDIHTEELHKNTVGTGTTWIRNSNQSDPVASAGISFAGWITASSGGVVITSSDVKKTPKEKGRGICLFPLTFLRRQQQYIYIGGFSLTPTKKRCFCFRFSLRESVNTACFVFSLWNERLRQLVMPLTRLCFGWRIINWRMLRIKSDWSATVWEHCSVSACAVRNRMRRLKAPTVRNAGSRMPCPVYNRSTLPKRCLFDIFYGIIYYI